MTPPPRAPHRAGTRPASGFAAFLAGSAVLHAAAVAAVLYWPEGRRLEEPQAGDGLALVFADVAGMAPSAPAGGGPGADVPAPPVPPPVAMPEATPQPPPPPEVAAPAPPLPPPPPEPPNRPAQASPPPTPAAALPAPPEAPAQALPAVPEPEPPAEAAPEREAAEPPPPPVPEAPPPAEPPARRLAAQPVPPRPPPAPRGGGVNLGAGIGAMADARIGAEAIGAVVPPGADAGHRNEPPDYPPESRRRGEEGSVRVSLRVGPDGRVQAVEVLESSGHPALDRAAVEAVRRWRFRPATQAGLPVAATMQTAVHFRLTEERRR
ncbi:protein TonB [Roseomonas alkaliterrae]|uniref:Protein TonB n=2 Tax=Neoroseomonas alkaliterrae TaxID=1452450 RepID=A0A840XPM7_9PROT|nr:protein TonB [Neoroseomonas alkaliterrae]